MFKDQIQKKKTEALNQDNNLKCFLYSNDSLFDRLMSNKKEPSSNDKRTLIEIKNGKIDDKDINIYVYQKSSGHNLSCRINYGQIEMYVPKYYLQKDFDLLLNKAISKKKNANLTIPFYRPDGYVYIFGKKRILTTDPFFKENEKCFYYSKNANDPIVKFKSDFLKYLKSHVVEMGAKFGIDLSMWKIRTGLFLSYYGVCFPQKKQLKFDFRLYSFRKEIIDSVIIHEICHTLESNHSNRFYSLVHSFCPNYDKLQDYLDRGIFDGGE